MNNQLSKIHFIIFGCSFSLLIIPPTAMSEPEYDKFGQLIVPGANISSGTIDQIGDEVDGIRPIIINDMSFKINKQTVFATSSGAKSNITYFTPGQFIVFYEINAFITKMWLDDNPEGEDPVQPPAQQEDDKSEGDDIYQEGGVWKN